MHGQLNITFVANF